MALSLLAFLLAGTVPFHWEPPEHVNNGAEWVADGALDFRTPGVVRTPTAPSWVEGAIERGRVRLQLRVRPHVARQYGPARIVTLSAGPYSRNLTVAQEGSDLVVRLRTHDTSANGLPEHVISGVFADRGVRALTIEIVPGALRVEIDGVEALVVRLRPQALENWNDAYRLAFGNEVDGGRPWLGEIFDARVRANGVDTELLRAASLEVPERYWTGLAIEPVWRLQRERAWAGWRDPILNLVCLVPVGALIVFARGARESFWFAVWSCAAASALVETLQLLSSNRITSARDLLLNVGGGALGAWWASRRAGANPR